MYKRDTTVGYGEDGYPLRRCRAPPGFEQTGRDTATDLREVPGQVSWTEEPASTFASTSDTGRFGPTHMQLDDEELEDPYAYEDPDEVFE